MLSQLKVKSFIHDYIRSGGSKLFTVAVHLNAQGQVGELPGEGKHLKFELFLKKNIYLYI